MLLQTNSYIVPKEKRNEHARLLRRFRQCLLRLGCDHFEVYEQVGANWTSGETTGRFVQIMRFRDRKHQLEVQTAERSDPVAQALVREFCDLINFPYQQQQGLFAVGFYTSFLRMPPVRQQALEEAAVEADDEPTPESLAAMQMALANSPEPGVTPDDAGAATELGALGTAPGEPDVQADGLEPDSALDDPEAAVDESKTDEAATIDDDLEMDEEDLDGGDSGADTSEGPDTRHGSTSR